MLISRGTPWQPRRTKEKSLRSQTLGKRNWRAYHLSVSRKEEWACSSSKNQRLVSFKEKGYNTTPLILCKRWEMRMETSDPSHPTKTPTKKWRSQRTRERKSFQRSTRHSMEMNTCKKINDHIKLFKLFKLRLIQLLICSNFKPLKAFSIMLFISIFSPLIIFWNLSFLIYLLLMENTSSIPLYWREYGGVHE